MYKVTLYSIPACPYCERAKALLKDRGVAFDEIKVDRNNQSEVQTLMDRSGMRTFPQIFSGETVIGGYTDLEKLDRQDQLNSLKS